MEMNAHRALAASQQQAWDALNDPEMLKLCIPGCDALEATGEHQYAVGMALKIGPVAAKFKGKLQVSEQVPPESYRIAFDGQGGVAGFGKGQAQVRLVPLPDDALGQPCCELHYEVQASVGGKIAQLGQRLIDGAAKGLAEDFFRRFDEQLRRRHGRAELPAPDDGTADAALTEREGARTVQLDTRPAAPGGERAAVPQPGAGIPVWVWGAVAALLVAVAMYLS
ncbi:MAG: carbon monoxide dehydrogenase subunit G [Simplicispira sp.]|jgi:carbon monoxide dehydrogenase subunit G|nr:carbon monoxide dehydrogenase subunit G [Simplicispira sp.]